MTLEEFCDLHAISAQITPFKAWVRTNHNGAFENYTEEQEWIRLYEEYRQPTDMSQQPAILARISIARVHEDSKLPVFTRAGDACMDCFADAEVTIPGFDPEKGFGRAMIPLGFKLALPKGWEAQIRPRSGLAWKEGITVLNTPGTIDENYRGEVCAIMLNTQVKSRKVEKGERICQLAVRPIYGTGSTVGDLVGKSCGVVWNLLDELDETNRGENGFGSSGKN